MNLYQLVAENAKHTPHKIACVFQQQELSYFDLIRRVKACSTNLQQAGLNQNSKIAIVLPNCIEQVIIWLAAAHMGCVIVPLPLTYKPKQLETAINQAQCTSAICWFNHLSTIENNQNISSQQIWTLGDDTDTLRHFKHLYAENTSYIEPNTHVERAFIFTLTSGSTGTPKPIVLTQRTKIERALTATINYYHLNRQDVVLVATPMYHSLAMRSVLMPLILGGKTVILPKFSVKAWFKAIEQHQVSFLFTVADQLAALIDDLSVHGHQLSSLRILVSSSATLNNELKSTLLTQLKCAFHECYGASEMGVVTDFNLCEVGVPQNSVGKPLPGVSIKVCDEQRTPLKTGQIGEIACLSPMRFSEYLNLADKTAASFDQQGYFYTGDLGYIDQQGYLFFKGRIKEMIKTGGISVYPADIEAVVRQFPGIHECAALGMEDPHFGEVLWLVYTVADPHLQINESQLRQYLLANLTDYQQPRKLIQLSALPKNEMGKIMKPQISEMLNQHSF